MRRAYLKKLISVLPKGLFAPNIFLSILAAKDGNDLLFIPITHVERKTGMVFAVKWKLIQVCIRGVKELVSFRLSLRKAMKKLKNAK